MLFLATLAPVLVVGCDDEPMPAREGEGADGGVHGDLGLAGETTLAFPSKNKVDVLLVIDDSAAMCATQNALADNLAVFADELVRDTTELADIRLAVISTDLRHPERGGRFLTGPAAEPLPEACAAGDVAVSLDCPADAGPIVKLSEIIRDCPVGDLDCAAQTFAAQVACRARVGVAGDPFRSGLESMRQALSCTGPNAVLFGACCLDGRYNPQCGSTSDPEVTDNQGAEFLRPGAVLEVVFVSSGNDCSAPEGALDRSDVNHCEWSRSRLTPVVDYYNFLLGLKARPREQLVVASVTGHRAYTAEGDLITYNPPRSPEALACLNEDSEFELQKRCATDADCPGDANTCEAGADGELRCTGAGAEATCCPRGQCPGHVLPSCEFDGSAAQAGRRYLEIAELMDRGFAAGAGCAPGDEGDPGACVTLCRAAWPAPMVDLVKSKLAYADHFGQYCLDSPVACLVDEVRPCNTLEELENPDNYAVAFSVRCSDSPDASNDCDPRVLARLDPQQNCQLVLNAAEWCQQVHGLQCADGFPRGSELHLSYIPGAPLR